MRKTTITLQEINFDEAQAQLNALPGYTDNVFKDNRWKFKNQRGNIINIDFNDLLNISIKHPDWPLANMVDWILLTKRLWLSLAKVTTPNLYASRLAGIKLFWAAMAHYSITQLNRDNSSEILTYLLTHSWWMGGSKNNPTIKSYTLFSVTAQIKAWKQELEGLRLDFISRNLTEAVVNRQLKNLISELTDNELTYPDWTQGGSYNMLTLDHGRYYVEHCLSFFEKHYPMAIAMASVIREVPKLAASLGYELSTVSNVLPQILRGRSPDEINRRWPTWSARSVRKIYKQVAYQYKATYQQARFEATLLQDNTLKCLVVDLGLQPSLENMDRMRVILWHWIRKQDIAETQRLLNECQPCVSMALFQEVLGTLKYRCDQVPCQLPSDEDYLAMGLVENKFRDSSNTYPRQLVRLVASAGLTSVVALTGWRKSEYGFSRSAINITRNDDRLDQYAFPWRYKVNWYVYKTSGKIREQREITFSIYVIAERLRSLFGATGDQACLYEVNTKNRDPFDSGVIVQRAVRVLWAHFVKNYSGFKLMDDYTKFKSLQMACNTGKSLTSSEEQERNRLLAKHSAEEWENLLIDINLKESWRRVREEWPRIEFYFLRSNNKRKKNWLIRYRDGTLAADWLTLLEAHLSDEMKDWIQSLPQEELRSRHVTRMVTSSFIESAIYPSPHAFRHMWAEAVYRRFDGDAGWMIRSQFKHISRFMWLSYIRDKDNRLSHEKAKAQVISSLVHNYLKHQGEGYVGQLHTWLRRLFKKTSILSPEEQEQLAERLATVEIENIKSNPWGYCLLKRRTRNRAKCAEMGEPMRHNASPDLCLGCVHNLMQTENIEWALFHVASHVEALKNPVVPEVFKASSYNLVKNVTRHVRTLNPLHEALSELQEVLDHYNASRAA